MEKPFNTRSVKGVKSLYITHLGTPANMAEGVIFKKIIRFWCEKLDRISHRLILFGRSEFIINK